MSNITFYSKDGTKLEGTYDKSISETDKCVIMCHGISADRGEGGQFDRLSDMLTKHGFSTLRFDFRCHGKSSGVMEDFCMTGEIEDLKAATDLMKEKGYADITLVGASFGGGIVSLYTARYPDNIKKVVLWNPLINYDKSIINPENLWSKENFGKDAMDRVEKYGYSKFGDKLRLGKKFFEDAKVYTPNKDIANLDKEVLFIHGTCDELIPFEHSIECSGECKNSKLVIVEGARHGLGNTEQVALKVLNSTVDFIVDF